MNGKDNIKDIEELQQENAILTAEIIVLRGIVGAIAAAIGMTWDHENACWHSFYPSNEAEQDIYQLIKEFG